MPQQLSVFLENKPGKLEKVTGLLAARGINIRAIVIADSGDFGVLKLLVDDPRGACQLLNENGLVAALEEVIAVRIPDRPGGLDRVARVLNRDQINLDDAYGFVAESGESAVFVIQVKEPDKVARILNKEGFSLLEEEDLYYL